MLRRSYVVLFVLLLLCFGDFISILRFTIKVNINFHIFFEIIFIFEYYFVYNENNSF